jgi:hypothetical protein
LVNYKGHQMHYPKVTQQGMCLCFYQFSHSNRHTPQNDCDKVCVFAFISSAIQIGTHLKMIVIILPSNGPSLVAGFICMPLTFGCTLLLCLSRFSTLGDENRTLDGLVLLLKTSNHNLRQYTLDFVSVTKVLSVWLLCHCFYQAGFHETEDLN